MRAKALRGVQFATKANGTPTAVLIDLRIHGALWEDFYDGLAAKATEGAPRSSLEQVKASLRKAGRLFPLRGSRSNPGQFAPDPPPN